MASILDGIEDVEEDEAVIGPGFRVNALLQFW